MPRGNSILELPGPGEGRALHNPIPIPTRTEARPAPGRTVRTHASLDHTQRNVGIQESIIPDGTGGIGSESRCGRYAGSAKPGRSCAPPSGLLLLDDLDLEVVSRPRDFRDREEDIVVRRGRWILEFNGLGFARIGGIPHSLGPCGLA